MIKRPPSSTTSGILWTIIQIPQKIKIGLPWTTIMSSGHKDADVTPAELTGSLESLLQQKEVKFARYRSGVPDLFVKGVSELTQPTHAKQTVDLIRTFQCVYAHIAPGFIYIYIVLDITQMKVIHQYDDITKWKGFLRYWPFVRGIHRSLVDSPNKTPVMRALMFSLMLV